MTSLYGEAYAAGALEVIARAFGFDNVADAALEVRQAEIKENFAPCLDEEKLGTCGVAERIEWAMSDTVPALAHAIDCLRAELEFMQRCEADRAAQTAALAKLRDELRATGQPHPLIAGILQAHGAPAPEAGQ
jgi:hypothetical protein